MTCHGRAGTCLLLVFFGASTGVFSDILFGGTLCAISGAEIFRFFVEFGFVWTAPMDSGRGKIFRSLYFWLFRGALFPVRFFRRYPEFRFLPFCPEFFFMGRVWQKLPLKNFAAMRFLVFLSVWRPCGGCFAIFVG